MKQGKSVVRVGETIILFDSKAMKAQIEQIIRNVNDFTGPEGRAYSGNGYVGHHIGDEVSFQYLAPQNLMTPIHCMQCKETATHMHESPEDHDMRAGFRCLKHTIDAAERGIKMKQINR